jgi:hypothetical protein
MGFYIHRWMEWPTFLVPLSIKFFWNLVGPQNRLVVLLIVMLSAKPIDANDLTTKLLSLDQPPFSKSCSRWRFLSLESESSYLCGEIIGIPFAFRIPS